MKKKNSKRNKLLVLLILPILLSAQDTLFFKNKTILAASVSEVDQTTIKYKRFDNLDGPIFVVNQTEISYIIYKNHTKLNVDSLVKSQGKEISTNPPDNTTDKEDMYNRGCVDATNNYCRNTGRKFCKFSGTCLGPLGLIPTTIISIIPPQEGNLGYPDEFLWMNQRYRAGYENTAERMKRRKVWSAYGQGLLTWLTLFSLLAFQSGR